MSLFSSATLSALLDLSVLALATPWSCQRFTYGYVDINDEEH
ncbi:hypothetical protein [Yersinia similis]|nr:hypothetical protein [Yersinia similis]